MTNDTLSQRRAESVVQYLIKSGHRSRTPGRLWLWRFQPRSPDRDMAKFQEGRCERPVHQRLETVKPEKRRIRLNRRTEFKVLRTKLRQRTNRPENINLNEPPGGLIIENNDLKAKEDFRQRTHQGRSEGGPETEASKWRRKGPGEIYTCKKGDTYTKP